MPPTTITRAQWTGAAIGLLAILVGAAWAYGPALSGPFVYDDLPFIVNNDAIKDPRRCFEWLLSPDTASEGLRWGTIFRPLRTVSYGLDFGAWRGNPMGYHLTSLSLHLAAVTGVFAFALRWTRHVGGALLGAAVFALHPLPAEAGLFIGARSDVMSVLPVLALALLALRPGPRSRGRLAAEMALLVVALGCKEASAAAIPAIALALWLRDPGDGGLRRAIRWSLPGVSVVGIYMILRTIAVGHGSRYGYLAGGDPFLTWGSALRARAFELGQVLRPNYLSPSYLGVPVMTTWADTAFWLACAATAGCAWIAWRCRRRCPTVTAGIGWWVLFLLPTSQLIPLNMLMGNRWLYAPFIGLAAIVASVVVAADRRWGANGRRVALTLGAVWVAHCGLQTHARAELWSNEEALWEDAQRSWPEDRIPYNALIDVHRRRVQRLQFTDPAGAEAARVALTAVVLGLVERAPVSIQAAQAANQLLKADRAAVARRVLEHAYAEVETPALELELSLASARWHMGDRAGAIELFDRLVSPTDHRTATVDRVRRGEVFYAFQGLEGAANHAARALYWLQRARLEFADGRVDQSDRSVRAARAVWPECQLAVWARATTLRIGGRPDLAMAELDGMWAEAAIQPLFELRAELAELGGQPDIALQTRIAAVERWPFVSSLWTDLAKSLQRAGEFGVARACFARAQDVAK